MFSDIYFKKEFAKNSAIFLTFPVIDIFIEQIARGIICRCVRGKDGLGVSVIAGGCEEAKDCAWAYLLVCALKGWIARGRVCGCER